MKKLIRIVAVIFILERCGVWTERWLSRIPSRQEISRRISELSGSPEEIVRQLGFEPQNPNAS